MAEPRRASADSQAQLVRVRTGTATATLPRLRLWEKVWPQNPVFKFPMENRRSSAGNGWDNPAPIRINTASGLGFPFLMNQELTRDCVMVDHGNASLIKMPEDGDV